MQLHSHQVDPRPEAQSNEYVSEQIDVDSLDVAAVDRAISTGQDPAVLSAELSLEARKFRRTIVRSMAGVALLEAGAIALKGVLPTEQWSRFVAWSQIPQHLLFSATLSFGLIGSLLVANSGKQHRKRRRALAAKVASNADVRSIGALIDALQLDDSQTRVTSLTALIKLLPRVTEADTGCITPTQRAKLYRILNTNVEDPFRKDIRVMFRPATDMAVGIRVSIVQALEVIGDDQALTIVTRLADSNARTAGEKLIREAALECLPLLKSRLEEQRTSATLLRASDSGSDHKNTLVRGHTGNFEHDERELLREGP